MIRCLAAAVLLGFTACTTVEIAEKYAFDAKKTVSKAQLDGLGYIRTGLKVPVGPNIELEAWHLRRQAGARGTLLYFGGNGYLMIHGQHIMQGILRGPADVFTVNYRGYGQSDGSPSIEALKKDALEVYDHVIKRSPGPVVVHGHSLGSFVALWVATQRPVAGVILETPVTNVQDLLGYLAPWWTRAFIRFDIAPKLGNEDNLQRIPSLKAPLLILAGEEDRVAHPDMAQALFEEAPGPDKSIHVVPEGNHNDLPPRRDYQQFFEAFLHRVLPASKTSTPTPSGQIKLLPSKQ